MLVNISFEDEEHLEYVDIINMPDEMAENLDEAVKEFFKWIFDSDRWTELQSSMTYDGQVNCRYSFKY